MKPQFLHTMFSYLRRAFTTKESKEILTDFFPEEKAKISDLNEVPPPPEAEVVGEDSTLSKMERARRIYAAAPDKRRGAVIRLFQDQIPDMTHNTASTYYYDIAVDRKREEPVIGKARKIYRSSPVKTRKVIMEKFMAIGIPKPVASTYYYKCKKEEAKRLEAKQAK